MSSLHQAAVLLSSLPQQQAAMVLSRLESKEQQVVLDEISRLNSQTGKQITGAIHQFVSDAQRWKLSDDTVGELDSLSQELRSAVQNSRPSGDSEEAFKFIVDSDPKIRDHLLRDEHPRNVAIILSLLPPEIASDAMRNLEPAARFSVVKRLCELEDVDEEEVSGLAYALKLRLKKMMGVWHKNNHRIKFAAELLSCSDPLLQETMLEQLNQTDPDLADRLEQTVFKFEKIQNLRRDEMRALLKDVDTSCWAPALKHASLNVTSFVLSCMAKRPALIVQQEMDRIGDVDSITQDHARQQVVKSVIKLARTGQIKLKQNYNIEIEESIPARSISPLFYSPTTSQIN